MDTFRFYSAPQLGLQLGTLRASHSDDSLVVYSYPWLTQQPTHGAEPRRMMTSQMVRFFCPSLFLLASVQFWSYGVQAVREIECNDEG